jgi:integrase
MLDSCDRATANGRRDLATLTLLARLGLRAGEVAGLRLEDIDWRSGVITVCDKGRRSERLPPRSRCSRASSSVSPRSGRFPRHRLITLRNSFTHLE